MFEQVDRLHEVYCSLSRACSLVSFTADYFSSAEPDAATLKSRYRMYGDINNTVLDVLQAETKTIESVYASLFDDLKKLKGVGA